MKHAPVHAKSTRQSIAALQQRPITGPNGIAIAPPTYGIDFVDRQQSTGIGMTVQCQTREDSNAPGGQRENTTGLSDDLKAGIENLAGLSLDDVHVHYNSAKPAQFRALAYTQGTDIHVAPGQEKHLPHEAWHVVQQKQGRVKPTFQLRGEQVNDDHGLEHEAEVMGERGRMRGYSPVQKVSINNPAPPYNGVVQCIPDTQVKWQYENKKDSFNNLEFTYPVMMEAIVSQRPGQCKGSPPDNTATWWPYFQERHKVMSQAKGKKLYWVQGHLLNDNIHGPGTPANLVPISNTTNTNMETKGERTAKDLVLKKNRVIYYKVSAHWNTTPDQKLKDWGPYDHTGKGFLPGECTAPDALSWQISTMKEQPPNSDNWVLDQQVQPPEIEWYNTFPEGHINDLYKMNIGFIG